MVHSRLRFVPPRYHACSAEAPPSACLHTSAFIPAPGNNGHRIPALPKRTMWSTRRDLGSRAGQRRRHAWLHARWPTMRYRKDTLHRCTCSFFFISHRLDLSLHQNSYLADSARHCTARSTRTTSLTPLISTHSPLALAVLPCSPRSRNGSIRDIQVSMVWYSGAAISSPGSDMMGEETTQRWTRKRYSQ